MSAFPTITQGRMLLLFDTIEATDKDCHVYNSVLAKCNIENKKAVISAMKASMDFIETVRYMPKEEKEYLRELEKDGKEEREKLTPDRPLGAWG